MCMFSDYLSDFGCVVGEFSLLTNFRSNFADFLVQTVRLFAPVIRLPLLLGGGRSIQLSYADIFY